jgi:hypothetical protein
LLFLSMASSRSLSRPLLLAGSNSASCALMSSPLRLRLSRGRSQPRYRLPPRELPCRPLRSIEPAVLPRPLEVAWYLSRPIRFPPPVLVPPAMVHVAAWPQRPPAARALPVLRVSVFQGRRASAMRSESFDTGAVIGLPHADRCTQPQGGRPVAGCKLRELRARGVVAPSALLRALGAWS